MYVDGVEVIWKQKKYELLIITNPDMCHAVKKKHCVIIVIQNMPLRWLDRIFE